MNMKPNYQTDDLEGSFEAVSLKLPKYRKFTKLALIVATLVLAFGVIHSSRAKETVALTDLHNKILTPEEMANIAAQEQLAARQAELKRISALPGNYLPALDYQDPCDAVRVECCIDPAYPVLGGMDLVHFRLTGQVQFGNPKSSAELQGLRSTYTFWFADKSAVAIFEADPLAYLPGWGGFDCGEFCSSGGGIPALMSRTVDLSHATEVEKKAAFSSLPVPDPKKCAEDFASFYGSPINGIFNTRCVSMKGLSSNPPIGLYASMPLAGIPVKMSQLYGISPGIPAGAKAKTAPVETFTSQPMSSTSQSIQPSMSGLLPQPMPGSLLSSSSPPPPLPMMFPDAISSINASPLNMNEPQEAGIPFSGSPHVKQINTDLIPQIGAEMKSVNLPVQAPSLPMSSLSQPLPMSAPAQPMPMSFQPQPIPMNPMQDPTQQLPMSAPAMPMSAPAQPLPMSAPAQPFPVSSPVQPFPSYMGPSQSPSGPGQPNMNPPQQFSGSPMPSPSAQWSPPSSPMQPPPIQLQPPTNQMPPPPQISPQMPPPSPQMPPPQMMPAQSNIATIPSGTQTFASASSTPNAFSQALDSFQGGSKPLGEKALLKRGIEDPSQLSPGLRDQLAGAPMGEKSMIKRGMEDISKASPGLIAQYQSPPNQVPYQPSPYQAPQPPPNSIYGFHP